MFFLLKIFSSKNKIEIRERTIRERDRKEKASQNHIADGECLGKQTGTVELVRKIIYKKKVV